MLSSQLAGIELASCIMNASGARCTTAEDLQALARSEAGAVVSKSCTLEAREGNPSPRYVDTAWGSINSMGLPNKGWQFYSQEAAQIADLGKPYIMSVSGLTLEENKIIIAQLQENQQVEAIELNLSCPNVPNKPQTGYDFEQVRRVLDAVAEFDAIPLGVKLPPYFDFVHFQNVADILNQYSLAFVTCINSIGNGLVIDAESESVVIKPKGGFGGLGGDIVKPTALANVRMFRQLLKPEIQLVGCGGVRTGQDVFEHILCGADVVQVGTQLMQEGVGVFARLNAELQALMQRKGYTSIADFKGKLKTL